MSPRIASPFLIGREAELGWLARLAAQAADGSFALALVKGDAGIGKTRLVEEFTASEACAQLLVVSGTCMPLGGEDRPFGPVIRALRRAPAEVLQAAASELPEVGVAELSMLIESLPRTHEHTRDGSRGAEGRQYEFLLDLIGRIADSQPVALVIEDIHWAEPSTRGFLSFMARNARRQSLLVIATHRLHDGEDLRALELYVGRLERNATVEAITLGPLTEAQVQRQIAAILDRPADPADVRRIAARTQGNPFYVEELIAHGDTSEVALPAGQTAVLLERVRELPPASRHALQTLAAFGRRVDHELLSAAAGLSEPALSEALRPAVDNHIVEVDATSFTFRHALTREAVYETLLPGERQRLHTAVATALHDRPHMTDAAELAVQWRMAGKPEAALAASIAAAQAAAGVYAYGEAVEHYKGVVSMWTGDRPHAAPEIDRAQILLEAADAANRAGVDQLPIEWCRLGLEALGDDPDPRRAAVFYERLGRFQDHHLDKSLEYYQRALACLDDGPSAERARLLGDEALTLSLSVHWNEARERAAQALEVALAAGAEVEAGFARSVLGLVLGYLGEFDAAEAQLDEACRIGEAHARPDDATRAYVNLGEVRRLRGDLRGARAVMDAGMEAARRLGVEASYGRYFALNAAEDEYELGLWPAARRRVEALESASLTWSETVLLHTVCGQLATGRGELETARAWLDGASGQLRDSSATEWTAYVGAARIEHELTAGRPQQAHTLGLREIERVHDRAEQLYTPGLVAVSVRAAAEVAQAVPAQADAAIDHAERQLQWLESFLNEHSPPIALTHLAVARAELDRARGTADPDAWVEIAQRWEQLEHPYRVAYARLREAEALRAATKERTLVAAPLGQALAILRELGAGPLLAQVETLARQARLLSKVVRQAPSAGPRDVLTNRELEVLALVAQGHSNRQIGDLLYITPRTAGLHVSRILQKLNVRNRHEAGAVARRAGLVDDR